MLFVGMLVFQLAGALILLLNSINGSGKAVIKNCFPGSNTVERDDDDNCIIPKENLQKSAHTIYVNIIAFFDLVIGYGMAAFSPQANCPTFYTVLVVMCGSIVLVVLEFIFSKLVVCIKYSKDKIISYDELKKNGVDTIITKKEIDEIFDEVFNN